MMNTSTLVSSSIPNSISGTGTLTISTANMNTGMMSDGMSEPSSPDSSFDTSDILSGDMTDDITIQLAHAGTVGMAAAAAIASGIRKKTKRPHVFETNPSIRKRQQTRLLRKLKTTIEEYTTRVGQQAVVLCCTPGKQSQSSNSYRVFGSQPLENVASIIQSTPGTTSKCVIRNCKGVVLQDLESTLSEQVPQNNTDHTGMHELPPLSIDGLPTSVDKMTQAQLRTFIPEMLKYSTGRSKPGWGKSECMPVWWPTDVPWANVRSDVRTTDEKKRVSWTEALRTMVKNCYKHHGREDLLNIFGTDQEQEHVSTAAAQTLLQTINNPDGTVSIIQIDTGPSSQVVTLPDGTQATVVHAINTVSTQQEANQAVQTLAEVAANKQNPHVNPVSVELNAETVAQNMATISDDGHIILTGDSIGAAGAGIVAIPAIPVSMYQPVGTTVTSLSNIQTTGNLQVAMPPVVVTKQEPMAGPSHTVIQDVIHDHTQTGLSSASSDGSIENLDNKIEEDS